LTTSTRQRLLDAAVDTIRRQGIVAVSARTIAAAAGANQALVFYHFGTVNQLLVQACRQANEARIAHYRPLLDEVGSLRELLELGRRLHAEERELGNVDVLAQLLAAAQRDEELAPAVADSLRRWTAEIEAVLRRVLAGTPVADALDLPGLARAVSGAFIGIELLEGVDPDAAGSALDALEQLAALTELIDELGPTATRLLRRRIVRRADPTRGR
jgi:AcrR family transcriptional regulator